MLLLYTDYYVVGFTLSIKIISTFLKLFLYIKNLYNIFMKYEFTIVANSKPLPFKTEQLISKRDIVTPEKKM